MDRLLPERRKNQNKVTKSRASFKVAYLFLCFRIIYPNLYLVYESNGVFLREIDHYLLFKRLFMYSRALDYGLYVSSFGANQSDGF
jgi:hypothetical protein